MPDLNDLIARNGVMAFNSGYQQGKRDAEARVLRILDELAMDDSRIGSYAYINDIKEYMNDEEIK